MLYVFSRNTKRTLAAVLLVASLAGPGRAGPVRAFAQDMDKSAPFSLSANIALVSDYRFRGISLSDKDIALQGGFDMETAAGLYAGAWASSIETFAGAETELDLYAGYRGALGGLAYDLGIIAYSFPGSTGTLYLEGYGAVSGAIDIVEWEVGAAYAFSQDNLADQDNIYLHLDGGLPLGTSGLSLAGHLGFEDGAFGDGKLDWSLGVTMSLMDFELGVSYVDTNLPDRLGAAAIVISLAAGF